MTEPLLQRFRMLDANDKRQNRVNLIQIITFLQIYEH